ncbi:MAG: hypothetical protein LBG43_08750 [Treponema sp.]|nr:hypothetical protein [Treponema sp.]
MPPFPETYVIPFPYFAAIDIACCWRKLRPGPIPSWEQHWLVYGTDYTATPPGKDDTGGTLTLLTQIPAEADSILIRRKTPATQEIYLHDNTRLHAKTIEKIADKLTMETQETRGLEVTKDDLQELRGEVNEAIETEREQREEADTGLGERIDTEEAAREEADTALGERIDTEEAARTQADTALGERIDAEETEIAELQDFHQWNPETQYMPFGPVFYLGLPYYANPANMPLAGESPAEYPAKWIAAGGESGDVTVDGIHADIQGNIRLKYFVTKEEYREIKTQGRLVPGARYIVTDKWRLPSIRDFSWLFANICAIRDATAKKTVDGVKQDGHGNTQLKQILSGAEYDFLKRKGKLIPGARYIIYDRSRLPSIRDFGWLFTSVCSLLAVVPKKLSRIYRDGSLSGDGTETSPLSADALETRLAAVETKNTGQDTAIADAKQAAETANANADKRIAQGIFSDTHNALVADMALEPEAGGLGNIRKTLKNVLAGENLDINVHIKSESGTLESQISKTDDENYLLSLEAVKLKPLASGAATYLMGNEADGGYITGEAYYEEARLHIKARGAFTMNGQYPQYYYKTYAYVCADIAERDTLSGVEYALCIDGGGDGADALYHWDGAAWVFVENRSGHGEADSRLTRCVAETRSDGLYVSRVLQGYVWVKDADKAYVDGAVAREATDRDGAIDDAIAAEITARNAAISAYGAPYKGANNVAGILIDLGTETAGGAEILFDILYNETSSGNLVRQARIHGQFYGDMGIRTGMVQNANAIVPVYAFKGTAEGIGNTRHYLWIPNSNTAYYPSAKAAAWARTGTGLFDTMAVTVSTLAAAPVETLVPIADATAGGITGSKVYLAATTVCEILLGAAPAKFYSGDVTYKDITNGKILKFQFNGFMNQDADNFLYVDYKVIMNDFTGATVRFIRAAANNYFYLVVGIAKAANTHALITAGVMETGVETGTERWIKPSFTWRAAGLNPAYASALVTLPQKA